MEESGQASQSNADSLLSDSVSTVRPLPAALGRGLTTLLSQVWAQELDTIISCGVHIYLIHLQC